VDGLPIPSDALRYMVAMGYVDIDTFLREGKEGARFVADTIANHGKTIDQVEKLLDFGCGCGRVIRHLRDCGARELHGSDANAKSIGWCQRFLEFATFKVNNLEPPLPYPDRTFDLIYAYSVFTHLTEPLQERWMDEMRRVLVPGGYLLLTVHGRKNAAKRSPDVLAALDRGEFFVVGEDRNGSNNCAAYHSERYVREVMARGFDVLEFIPQGAKVFNPQDSYLLKLKT
jgi:SAM-dependent methyltransferase